MSFKLRLTLAFLVLVGASLGAASSVTYFVVQSSELRQLDTALLANAREEAAEVALLGGNHLAVQEGDGPVTDDLGPLATYAALYSTEGALIAWAPEDGPEPPALEVLDAGIDQPFDLELGDRVSRAVVVRVPGRNRRLLIAAPRSYLDADLHMLARTLGYVLIAALFGSGVIAFGVLGRMTQDHRTIAEVARRVAAGDLSARVEIQDKGAAAQLARDINYMIERIERLVGSQQRFIANASHELRSPLTLLYGELSHALRRSRDVESYQRAIEEALESTRRLKRLTEHLLALARLSGAPIVEGAILDLTELARSTVRSRTANLERPRVRVEGGEAKVRGQATDLEQMVWNLVDNALRHSPEDGEVRVEVENGERVRLSVRDQGEGIPEAHRARIFEPFYRSPWARSRHEGGTGLGLAIVRETARAHGGDVRVETSETGAHFVVELPSAS